MPTNPIVCLLLLIVAPTIYSQAMDFTQVRSLLQKHYQLRAFPGAVLLVANGTKTLFHEAVGSLSLQTQPYSSAPMDKDTIFDIASLTKVTATLSVIMKLYEVGYFQLFQTVASIIPQFGNNNKQNITIQNLLLHNSGLAPDYPSPFSVSKQTIMKWIYNCTKFIYSDLSFILLGEIAERLTKMNLEILANQWMQDIGLSETSFLPNLQNLLWRIAPTEFSTYRQKVTRGIVHDPTSYLFGGVAGHAGFFSKASDLAIYMQIHLNNGMHPNNRRVYEEQVVRKFYTRVDGLPYQNRRALGWDTVPIQDTPPCGRLISLNSFGHTGYTGTMMWADRDRGIIIVLLTNRVHPTSQSLLIAQARLEISDAIIRAYDNSKKIESSSQNDR